MLSVNTTLWNFHAWTLMTNNKTNPSVDEFISKEKRWQEEFVKLRAILLNCDLVEDFKWLQPCSVKGVKN